DQPCGGCQVGGGMVGPDAVLAVLSGVARPEQDRSEPGPSARQDVPRAVPHHEAPPRGDAQLADGAADQPGPRLSTAATNPVSRKVGVGMVGAVEDGVEPGA